VTAPTVNLHATVLVLDGNGVIIFGMAGAGKTSLALELIHEAKRDKIEAQLVADDRVDVILMSDGLSASAPTALAGLVEVRGSGIHKIEYAASTLLSLAVELVEAKEADRMSALEPREVAHDVALPLLRLPIGDTGPQVRAILAHLGLYTPLRH
jgi:serine kinase of HPr protein (carbohydrate metabolism regulator)